MFSFSKHLWAAALTLAAALPVFSQAPNDECAQAVALTVSAGTLCNTLTEGSTEQATVSALPLCPECPTGADVWYRFTANKTVHAVRVSNARTVQNHSFYPQMHLSAFAGTCSELLPMHQEAEFYNEAELVLGDLTAGQTYYLRLFGSQDNEAYPVRFDICVNTLLAPANDECAGAALIQPNSGTGCYFPASGSILAATPSRTDCEGQAVADVWYAFVATNTSHRVQLSPNVQVSGYGFEMYAGSECGQLTTVGCAQGTSLSRTFEGLVPGIVYYLRVFGAAYQYPDFQVCITNFPPPPTNDECAGALPLTVNPGYQTSPYTSGSTLGATSSKPRCGGTEPTHDVWYSFEATAPTHRIQLAYVQNIFGSFQDLGYEVYRGECGVLTSLICANLNQSGAVLSGLTPGETYWVRVYSLNSSNHGFELSVQTLPLPPVNLTCATATTLSSGPLPIGGTPVAGSTAGIVLAQPATACSQQGEGMFAWYAFSAEQPIHVVRLEGGAVTQYGYGDWWVEVLEGSACGSLQELGCFGYEDFFAKYNGLYLENLTIGATYYLRFGSPTASAHSFQISLGHYPVPPNDDCTNALPLTVHGDLNCYYPSSSNTASSTTSQPASVCLAEKNDLWFRFKAVQATQRAVVYERRALKNGADQQLTVELLTGGDCGTLTHLQCWSDLGQNPEGILTLAELEPGQTYWLRIAQPDNVPTSFKICLLTPPPPPTNDRCTAALALPVAAPGEPCEWTEGTTQYASSISTQPPLCCDLGDVWYTFTASRASHEVRLNDVRTWYNNGQYAYDNHAEVEIYAANCGGTAPLAKQALYYSTELKLSNLSPGATYLVRVYPKSRDYITFNICISTPEAPTNDECAGALPFAASEDLACSFQQFDAEGATPSQPGCGGVLAGDLWYQFTATATTYLFDCSPAYYGDSGGRGIEILSGDCGGALISFACKKLSAGREIWEQSGFVPSTTYYVRLWDEDLRSRLWEICTRALPAPPPNNDCAQALPLTVNHTLPCNAPTFGTTLGATQTQPDCAGEETRDVWYTFTAEDGLNLLTVTIEQAYLYGDTRIGAEVLESDCAAGKSVFCQNSTSYSASWILPDVTAGQPYRVRIFNQPLKAYDFSVCVSVLPKPANDDCAQAITAVVNPDLSCALTTPGTTLGAEAEGNATQPDVWYTFTALSAGQLIELRNLTPLQGWAGEVHWQVYRGQPCNLGDLLSEHQELVKGLTPGETYTLRVYAADPQTWLNFDLCIRSLPPSPVNTTCATAQTLPVNLDLVCDQMLHGNTAGLLGEPGYGTGCNHYNQLRPIYELWYSFTALSPNHRVRAVQVTPVIGYGSWYFGLTVLKSSDCGQFEQLGCTNDENEILLRDLTPGQTYYVVVYNSESGARHEFDLCVTTHPVPPNDLCANALPLPVVPDEQCTDLTLGNTFSASISPEPTECLQPAQDVWYTFTATHPAHTLQLDEAYGDGNIFLEIYGGDCGQLKKLFCYTQPSPPYHITLGDLTPGAQYWVRVGGKEAYFKLCIRTPEAVPPPNDRCADATVLAVSPDQNCSTAVSGTTFGATPSIPLGAYYQSYRAGNDVWYTFTATQANHAVVLSNFFSNADYLGLTAYTGSCGSLTPVEGTRLYNSYNELKLLDLTPGETYHIQVLSHPFIPQTFDICVVSLPAPPNDECAGAILLNENTNLTCEVLNPVVVGWASSSGPDCTGGVAHDVWYKWMATSTDYRLDVWNRYSPQGFYIKFGIEVLEGDCGSPMSVVLPCAEQTRAGVELHQLSVGKTYYLRLYANLFDFLETNICLYALPAPPPNDDCAQAIEIQVSNDPRCGTAYSGTTLSATPSGKNCEGGNTSDVWYRFTATSTECLLELTPTAGYFEYNGAIGFMLYRGDDCGTLSEVGCFNVYGVPPFLPKLTVGVTYYIRVFSPQGSAHDFTFCLRNLPLNTHCASALRIVASPDEQCGQPTPGSTTGLSEAVFSNCDNSYYHTALWYRFTATSGVHIIRLQNVTHQYGNNSLSMELLSSCFSYPLGCGQELFATGLTPGQDYFVRVVGYINSGSRFDLCITTPKQPANDNCPGVVTLPVSPLYDCTSTAPGMTLGATGSYNKFDCKSGPDVLYRFVATNAWHYIRLSNVEPADVQGFLEVLQGPCGNWTATLGCYPLYAEILVEGFVPGETYYLRIGSQSLRDYFQFEVCVATPQPDPYLYYVNPWNNGCNPGTNENVNVHVGNGGLGSVVAQSAQFTLTLTGANTGTYGPITNAEVLLGNSQMVLIFSDVDLSKPGETQLAVTMTALNDLNPGNNTVSGLFTDLPKTTFFLDADGDGHGDATLSVEDCQQPPGYVLDNTDCDDHDPARNPNALEICDGLDNDCDGLIDAADPSLFDPPQPSITCPADLTVNHTPGFCHAVVQYTVSTDDNCGYIVEQFAGLPSGAEFPVGQTLNIFTVSGPGTGVAECAFLVTVEKTADPSLSSAYSIIGFNDVFLQNNTVQSGGVGVTGAGKKVRLQSGTSVTATNTFVKAPVLELGGGSQVATTFSGQVSTALIPAFKPNLVPTNNNLTIPNNAPSPVVLPLASYGTITVGLNSTVIFSGNSSVRLGELTLKEGARVFFQQNTELLVTGLLAIGRSVRFNEGGAWAVQGFVRKNITVNSGAAVWADLYTQQDLRLEKTTAALPISMTGRFIANNVHALDFAYWSWDPTRCAVPSGTPQPLATDRDDPVTSADLNPIRISPNPASERAQVIFALETASAVVLRLFDATGQLVRTERWAGTVGENQFALYLGDLPEGLYVVQVLAEGQRWSVPLSVLRD